jgi:predicted nucleic acid-binding protein
VILADTSVWIDHLNRVDRALQQLLDGDEIVMHPFVIGEVALGNWPNRARTLYGLRRLQSVQIARNEEVLSLIDDWARVGTGIGYLDAHLLASVLLTSGSRLWTRDKSLRKVAKQLSLDAGLS